MTEVHEDIKDVSMDAEMTEQGFRKGVVTEFEGQEAPCDFRIVLSETQSIESLGFPEAFKKSGEDRSLVIQLCQWRLLRYKKGIADTRSEIMSRTMSTSLNSEFGFQLLPAIIWFWNQNSSHDRRLFHILEVNLN